MGLKRKLGLTCTFDAAHFLPDYNGKCANLHGHTWKVEAVISGEVENDNLIDFGLFKLILNKVVGNLDHSLLNDTITVPTAENIAQYIWDGLSYNLLDAVGWEENGGFKQRNTTVVLETVRVWESSTSFAEIERD